MRWRIPHSPVFALLYERLRIPALLLMVIFFGGSLVYWGLGRVGAVWDVPGTPWKLIDCFFMTAITLTTIGYGDVLGIQQSGYVMAEVYTIALAFVGMAVALYAVSEATSFFVEGHIGKLMEESRRMEAIERLEAHLIVCGLGETGLQIAEEFMHTRAKCVAIEQDAARAARTRVVHPALLVIEGDATDEEVLKSAGIARARGLAAALDDDKANLFLVVTARALNPGLKIVAKAEAPAAAPKLQAAGATNVVSTARIGGMRIASALVRPHVVTFLDRMISHGAGQRMEEIVVEEGSDLAGKTLAQARIFERTGLIAMAIRMPDGEYVYNPAGGTRIEPGAILVVIGTPDQVLKLRSFAS